MKLRLVIFFALCVTTLFSLAQNDETDPALNIGDPAPPLLLQEWLKGAPVKSFHKDSIYVLEFWATWCQPCKAAMPRLSVLARQYRKEVIFIGIDVYEKRLIQTVRKFVDSMGLKMDYRVAAEDSNFMATGWLDASGNRGIPATFVIKNKKISWMGHPMFLEQPLDEIVLNNWNVDSAIAKVKLDRELRKLELDAVYELVQYRGNQMIPWDLGKPDSTLAAIDRIINKEPRLRYAPGIAYSRFVALLKTNPHQAYDFGRALMKNASSASTFNVIVDGLRDHSGKLLLPPEIYLLGAQTMEVQLKEYPYPELINVAKRYDQIAEWYWKAGEKTEAIKAQQQAIDLLKSRKDFSAGDLAGYKFRLKQYNEM